MSGREERMKAVDVMLQPDSHRVTTWPPLVCLLITGELMTDCDGERNALHTATR